MLRLDCKKTFDMLARCEAVSPRNPWFKISSILIVGGLLAKDQTVKGKPINSDSTELCHNDYRLLQNIISELVGMGIRLENPTVNLSNALYDDDFVDNPTQRIDLIILSWVNKDNPDDPTGYFTSPALTEGKTWEGALAKANPFLLAVHGKPEFDCVSEDDIPDFYEKIVTIDRGFTIYQGPGPA